MHTSYLKDGQCLTDKDYWKFFIIYTYMLIILFPVRAGIKNEKLKIKSKNQKIKKSKNQKIKKSKNQKIKKIQKIIL